jgi:tRNA (Thr-GGU) A37 N-methylase
MELRPIAVVESPLRDRADAPKQGHEGAPDAWLAFVPDVADALGDLEVGDRLILLTWFDRADRSVLRV